MIVAHTIMNWYDPKAVQVQRVRAPWSTRRRRLYVDDGGVLRLARLDVARRSRSSCAGSQSCSVARWATWLRCAASRARCSHGSRIATSCRSVARIDHSLGVYADVVGFLILAGAGITVARSRADVGDWRGFLTR